MPRTKFKKLIKNRIETKALEYLQTKRGSKGKEIRYKTLEMSEFLLPFNSSLDIEEKRKLFEKRNRMTAIPYNFGQKEEKCICGEIEDMLHIYNCENINAMKPELSYDKIYNGNLKSQIEVFRRIEKNLEMRQEIKIRNISPCNPSDPLYCVSYQYRFRKIYIKTNVLPEMLLILVSPFINQTKTMQKYDQVLNNKFCFANLSFCCDDCFVNLFLRYMFASTRSKNFIIS